MNTKSIKLCALALATLLASQPVQANNHFELQGGGQPKPKVEKVQLGIIVPPAAACPVEVTFKVWVFTTKPTTVPIMLVNANSVLGPYDVETFEGANGVTMGSYEHTMTFGSSAEVSYRAAAPFANKASNWVPAVVDCEL